MAAPDEFLVQKADRVVLWFHNWGIKRMWLMRGIIGLILIGETIEAGLDPNVSIFGLSAIIASVFLCLLLEEWRRKSVSLDTFNATNAAMRTMGIIVGLRLSIVLMNVLFIAMAPMVGEWDFSGIPWILWWYFMHTFEPKDPPKRSVKELFEKRSMAHSFKLVRAK